MSQRKRKSPTRLEPEPQRKSKIPPSTSKKLMSIYAKKEGNWSEFFKDEKIKEIMLELGKFNYFYRR
jgi:hypothetical protein